MSQFGKTCQGYHHGKIVKRLEIAARNLVIPYRDRKCFPHDSDLPLNLVNNYTSREVFEDVDVCFTQIYVRQSICSWRTSIDQTRLHFTQEQRTVFLLEQLSFRYVQRARLCIQNASKGTKTKRIHEKLPVFPSFQIDCDIESFGIAHERDYNRKEVSAKKGKENEG